MSPGLTVTKAAEVLGVTRQALNNVVNARSGISPEMAVRLAKAFSGTPEAWLRMQMAYDLAQVRSASARSRCAPCPRRRRNRSLPATRETRRRAFDPGLCYTVVHRPMQELWGHNT